MSEIRKAIEQKKLLINASTFLQIILDILISLQG